MKHCLQTLSIFIADIYEMNNWKGWYQILFPW